MKVTAKIEIEVPDPRQVPMLEVILMQFANTIRTSPNAESVDLTIDTENT